MKQREEVDVFEDALLIGREKTCRLASASNMPKREVANRRLCDVLSDTLD